MKLFKSKRVKELEDTIIQLQMTISDKDDYIRHLKEEIAFLQGRNHVMWEETRKNVVTYMAAKHVPKHDAKTLSLFDFPEDLIKRDLAETLMRCIMPHLKIEKREQERFGTVYETRIRIVEGENE